MILLGLGGGGVVGVEVVDLEGVFVAWFSVDLTGLVPTVAGVADVVLVVTEGALLVGIEFGAALLLLVEATVLSFEFLVAVMVDLLVLLEPLLPVLVTVVQLLLELFPHCCVTIVLCFCSCICSKSRTMSFSMLCSF